LASDAGAPEICTEATKRILSMLASLDEFVDIAVRFSNERATNPVDDGVWTEHSHTFEDAVARLILAICDLEFIRGVILSQVAGTNTLGVVKPGSHSIFKDRLPELQRLLGRVPGQDICGADPAAEGVGTAWVRWLRDKMTLRDTFGTATRLQGVLRNANESPGALGKLLLPGSNYDDIGRGANAGALNDGKEQAEAQLVSSIAGLTSAVAAIQGSHDP